MSDILKDNRFAKYLNDPRYRQIPKHERKVKIDKRFQSMFSDEKFKVKYSVDKRGRPVNETSTENLRKYYELEESDDETSDEDSETGETKIETQNEQGSQEDEGEQSNVGRFVRRLPSDDEDSAKEKEPKVSFQNDKLERGALDKKTKKRLLDLDIDYARGEGIYKFITIILAKLLGSLLVCNSLFIPGVLMTDSSSDEESSGSEDDSELEHEWGELDADAETTEESTKR